MAAITTSKGPKPVQLLKALFQCAGLFCVPGLIITFFAPSFTIELTRVNPERVDAAIFKNILFIVPIFRYSATHILNIESHTLDGGVIRNGNTVSVAGKITGEAEDHGVLVLKGRPGESVEVYVSPKSLNRASEKIQNYMTESKEPKLRMWVVSNWKFGLILPGCVLLFCLVVFFMAVWSVTTSKPLDQRLSGHHHRLQSNT